MDRTRLHSYQLVRPNQRYQPSPIHVISWIRVQMLTLFDSTNHHPIIQHHHTSYVSESNVDKAFVLSRLFGHRGNIGPFD
jgi:hypothetical protein